MPEPVPDIGAIRSKVEQIELSTADLTKALSDIQSNHFWDSTEKTLLRHMPEEKVRKLKDKVLLARKKELMGPTPTAETPVGFIARGLWSAGQFHKEQLKGEDPGFMKNLAVGAVFLPSDLVGFFAQAPAAPERVIGSVVAAVDAHNAGVPGDVIAEQIARGVKEGSEGMLAPVIHPIDTFEEDPAMSLAFYLGAGAEARGRVAKFKAERTKRLAPTLPSEKAPFPGGTRIIQVGKEMKLTPEELLSEQTQARAVQEQAVRRVQFEPQAFAESPVEAMSRKIQEEVLRGIEESKAIETERLRSGGAKRVVLETTLTEAERLAEKVQAEPALKRARAEEAEAYRENIAREQGGKAGEIRGSQFQASPQELLANKAEIQKQLDFQNTGLEKAIASGISPEVASAEWGPRIKKSQGLIDDIDTRLMSMGKKAIAPGGKSMESVIRQQLYGAEKLPGRDKFTFIKEAPGAPSMEQLFLELGFGREEVQSRAALAQKISEAVKQLEQSPVVRAAKDGLAEASSLEKTSAPSRDARIKQAAPKSILDEIDLERAILESAASQEKTLEFSEYMRSRRDMRKFEASLKAALERVARPDPVKLEAIAKDPILSEISANTKRMNAGLTTELIDPLRLSSEAARPLPGAYPQWLKDSGTRTFRLLQEAPGGAKLVSQLRRYRTLKEMNEVRVNGIVSEMFPKGWTKNDSEAFSAMIEGRRTKKVITEITREGGKRGYKFQETNISGPDNPQMVEKALGMWRVLSEEMHQRAKAHLPDIGKIEKYYPHLWREAVGRDPKLREAIIESIRDEHFNKAGKRMPLGKAERLFNDVMMRQRKRIAGNLEMRRRFNLSGYITDDAASVIREYLLRSEDRILQTKLFGKDDVVAKAIIDRIRSSSPEAAQLADWTLDKMLRRTSLDDATLIAHQRASNIRAMTSTVLLGLTTGLMQTSQALYMSAASSLVKFLRALPQVPSVVRTAKAHGLLTDTMSHPLLTETADAMFRVATIPQKLAKGVYTVTGARYMDTYLRGVGIILGREKAIELITEIKQGGKRAKNAMLELEDAGVDVPRAKNYKIETLGEEIEVYARHWSDRANQRTGVLELPKSWQSPIGSVFSQYKGFALNAAAGFKDILAMKLKTEGAIPALNSFGQFLVGSQIWGEFQRNAKEMLNGTQEQRDEIDAVLNNLAMLGVLGIAEPVFSAKAPAQALERIVSPPALGAAKKAITAIAKGKPEEATRLGQQLTR